MAAMIRSYESNHFLPFLIWDARGSLESSPPRHKSFARNRARENATIYIHTSS